MTVLGFNDSCQEGEHSRLQGQGSPGKDGPGVSQNMARTMDTLRESLSNLEGRVTRIEMHGTNSQLQERGVSVMMYAAMLV